VRSTATVGGGRSLLAFGNKELAVSETIIKTTEEGLKYLEAHSPLGDGFHLAISDSFTFAGEPDRMGAGMAILLDRILGLGCMPDGFEQKTGFRLYAYTKMR
jgi:hypothetical protein